MMSTQLVYCLSHYKGDEKVKPHIHRLIDPRSQSEISGLMGKYQHGISPCIVLHSVVMFMLCFIGKSSRYGFTEDDYVALLAKNPETLFQDDSYMKHLRRNATKYVNDPCVLSSIHEFIIHRILLRTRQLHVIRWQMLEPFLDRIKKNVHYK